MTLNINAMRWCWSNGIKIYPHPLLSNGTVLKVMINNNGNERLGNERFTPKTIYKKINELYTELYNNHKNQ